MLRVNERAFFQLNVKIGAEAPTLFPTISRCRPHRLRLQPRLS